VSYNRGWSTEPEPEKPKKTEWTAVVNPEPVFDGAEEKRRYENAVAANPRVPGDDVVEWLDRVTRQAKGLREPGED
jgi:hypothetical protein